MSGTVKLRILVAEDNAVNQAVIRGMLEYAGHQVDTVDNGEKAISALRMTRYDLVIMDCMMPVMDGFSATRGIRAAASKEFDPEIPILAITALATAEDKRRCLEAGMSAYISKPVMAKDLFAWIDSQFPNRALSSSGIGHHPENRDGSIDADNLLKNMYPAVLHDADQWQKELRILCDSGRLPELSALAHKIRGTADLLGDRSTSKRAGELEVSARADNRGETPGLTQQLIVSLQRLVGELQKDD